MSHALKFSFAIPSLLPSTSSTRQFMRCIYKHCLSLTIAEMESAKRKKDEPTDESERKAKRFR
jgi:hypothetical protein